jgi:hypothetical protein
MNTLAEYIFSVNKAYKDELDQTMKGMAQILQTAHTEQLRGKKNRKRSPERSIL